MNNESEIYQHIFQIVENNMISAGDTFPYAECTFLHDVNTDPCTVDISRYTDLDNPDFLQAVFVASYKRLPEEKEQSQWQTLMQLPKAEFQTAVLKNLVRSSAVAINHIHFIHIPYFEYREGIRYHIMGILYGLTDKSSLREFGKKMPAPVQKIIRRIFI